MRPAPAEKAAAHEAARADKDTIINRYRAGETVPRIAADYDVTQTWLTLRFNDWGVPRRQNQAAHMGTRHTGRTFRGRMDRRTKAEVQQARDAFTNAREDAIKRYQGGESAASLARSFHVDTGWIAKRLDEWGVPRRDRSAAAVVRGPGVRPL